MSARWFVVCVVGGREKRARANLEELGLTVYLPIEARWRRQAGRKIRAERALFPGYLFAEARDEDLHLFRDVDGVHSLLSRQTPAGPVAVPIPEAFVTVLQQHEAAGDFDATIPTAAKFEPSKGVAVRVTGGPMKDRIGTILSVKAGAKRVRVMLESVGLLGAGPASLDIAILEAA